LRKTTLREGWPNGQQQAFTSSRLSDVSEEACGGKSLREREEEVPSPNNAKGAC
jgi:hypothetical protein